jgi:hypothetical protein
MRTGAVTVLLLLLLTPTACIDLTPVEPPPAQPVVLRLSLSLGDEMADPGATAGLVRVSANLEPGVDAGGHLREVVNDTLWLLEQPVAPVETGRRGARVYSAELFASAARLRDVPIMVRTPVLASPGGQLFQQAIIFHWPLVHRLDPAELTTPEGSDLLLRLGFSRPDAQPTPSLRRWSIGVFRPDGWFSQGADAFPPPEVRLPAELLGAGGTTLTAFGSVHQSAELGQPGTYVIRLELTQDLRWRVVVEDGE